MARNYKRKRKGYRTEAHMMVTERMFTYGVTEIEAMLLYGSSGAAPIVRRFKMHWPSLAGLVKKRTITMAEQLQRLRDLGVTVDIGAYMDVSSRAKKTVYYLEEGAAKDNASPQAGAVSG